MRKHVIIVTLALSGALAQPARAQWLPGGISTGGGNSTIVPGAGSVLHAGGGSAKRYSEAGVLLETTSFSGGGGAPDGLGGIVSLWTTGYPQPNVLYVSRVTSSLSKPWGTGVLVIGGSYVGHGTVCGDGTGSAFVAWTDNRTYGTTGNDVYVQKVSAAGAVQWTANGVVMNSYVTHQQTPSIVSDGSGGCIVAWADGDIYAQRVTSAGTKQWSSNGQPIRFGGPVEDAPIAVSDAAGGAIIAWIDYRDGSADLYAQRINATGFVQWTAEGIAVAAPAGGEVRGRHMVADGAGGAILVWEQRPNGGTGNIYAQRLNASGVAQWGPEGIPIATGSQHRFGPVVGLDGSGGALIAWCDLRFGGSATFLQQVDGAGAPTFAANGVFVDLGTFPAAVGPDGAGGTYLLETIGTENYYGEAGKLQRVFSDGAPAWVPNYAPVVTVADVSSDQGGWVKLQFARPLYDGTAYNVWRRDPMSAAVAADAAARPSVVVMKGMRGRVSIEDHGSALGFPAGNWASLGTHPALMLSQYVLNAPTRDDSTSGGPADDDFVVSSQISPSLWVVSAVATGHSVDNLPPAMPVNFEGSVTGDHTAQLNWQGNGERDLDRYRVYRGTSESFDPAPENLIGSPTSPALTDASFDPGVSHYKVCARDVHGNVSAFALLTPSQITGVGGPVPSVSFLARPAPNPARSQVLLAFGLARSEHASLDVVDARGRIVRRLVDGHVEAGTRRWTWDGRDGAGRDLAAGIYWVVLRTPTMKQVQRLAWLD